MVLVDPDQQLALGAPTFGWLEAAFRSMDLLKTDEFAAAIETPVTPRSLRTSPPSANFPS